jgi:virginiamycin B lyase
LQRAPGRVWIAGDPPGNAWLHRPARQFKEGESPPFLFESMIPKSGDRFPAFAKPASAGEGRSDKIMRKNRRGNMVPIVVAAVTVIALGINPAPAAQVSYYDVKSGAHPHDVAPAPDGTVWYTAQHQGALGILDPKTNKVTHIPLGQGAAPHGVIVGPDRAAWITDSGQNAIARFDPATKAVKLFPLPKEFPNANLNTAPSIVKAFCGSRGKAVFTGVLIRRAEKSKPGKRRKAPGPTASRRRRTVRSGMPRLLAITLPRSIP